MIEKNYKVGQIIYAIIEEKHIIIPVKIIEQIVVKNLEGEQTNYKVMLPNKKNQKVSIDKLSLLFNDLDEVNEYLIKNAKNSIDKMIESAIEIEDKYFLAKIQKNDASSISDIDSCKIDNKESTIKSDSIKIDLGDGQIANISQDEIQNLPINKD
jgi:hypothetical protein